MDGEGGGGWRAETCLETESREHRGMTTGLGFFTATETDSSGRRCKNNGPGGGKRMEVDGGKENNLFHFGKIQDENPVESYLQRCPKHCTSLQGPIR